MVRWSQQRIVGILLFTIALFLPGNSQARVVGLADTVPLASLPINDPIRQSARPIGQLITRLPDGSVHFCTAAIISDRYILTASHCVENSVDVHAVFGEGADEKNSNLRIITPPLESNKELDFALLELEQAAPPRLGAARLLVRIPIKGESAFVVGVDPQGKLFVSSNCTVHGTDRVQNPEAMSFLHDCDTFPGSAGGFVFSSKDSAILGLHLGSRDLLNYALPMYSVALFSDLVREVATVKPLTIDYRTTSNNPKEMASEFKRLYLTLHNTGRLPYRMYEVKDFVTIENVFRSNGLFHGDPFPVELDSLACDMNPDFCRRLEIEATPEERSSLTRHILKPPSARLKPTIGDWSKITAKPRELTSPDLPTTHSLLLPSIQFERQQDWVVYRKRPGQDIEGIVTRELGGCAKFDTDCSKLIKVINRKQEIKLQPEYSGTVLLPKASFVARGLDISTATEKGAVRAIEVKGSSSGDDRQIGLRPDEVATSKVTRRSGTDYRVIKIEDSGHNVGRETSSDLDSVLKSLGSSASGSAQFTLNSTTTASSSAPRPHCNGQENNPCELDPSDFSTYQKRLINGINFPYSALSAFPPAIKDKGGGTLGIVDTELDLRHCALDDLFKKNRLVAVGNVPSPPAPEPPPSEPCKWVMPHKKIDTRNHGTHVAGLMAGKINDASWGLNPFATLYASQVTPTTIGQQVQVSILDLANLLQQMIIEAGKNNNTLDVINLSMFYPKEAIIAAGPGGTGGRPRGDPVLDVIRTTGSATLFVVAAGNDGEDFTAICDMRPTCLDLPNVISVAAVEGQTVPDRLYSLGSNYGRRVHVAAPGRDILGLINGHYLGLFSGTSQAAPQVAAVASLLRTLKPLATPAEIKERLITCSVPIPYPGDAGDEDAEAIFGGKIDATCSLLSEGMLQLKNSAEIIRVKKIETGQSDLKFKPAVSDYDIEIVIPQKSLRSLRANVDQGEFTAFYKRSPQDPNAPLSKEARLNAVPIDAQELKLFICDPAVLPPNCSMKKQGYRLNTISRFVAPMLNR